ncbi:MAG: FHA domain-containing protein [Rikenellaceae bacterium]|nr:FHA domain-containing protein [Rikenellaceae bacterium]
MKTFKIGRGMDNDLVLNVPSVSSRHADLTYDDKGAIILTDHSTNGTFVNGQVLQNNSVMVNYGDPIMFPGGVQLDWGALPCPEPPQPAQPTYTPTATPSQQQYANPVPQPVQSQPVQQPYGATPNYNEGGYNGGGIPTPPPTPSMNDASMNMGAPIGMGGRVTLSFSRTMSEGFSSGLRNALSFSAIYLLVMLTFWIPYINLGVMVACAMLPLKWANGEMLNPTEIFHSQYRRQIGNYMLLSMFILFGFLILFIPFVIPAYVFMLGWMLAPLMLLYRDMNPLEAMTASYRATYGSKWTIFGVLLVTGIASLFAMLPGIALAAWGAADEMAGMIVLGALLMLVAMVIMLSVCIGVMGSIWNQLKDKDEY